MKNMKLMGNYWQKPEVLTIPDCSLSLHFHFLHVY